jgi:N-acetylmuramoyl-L-alanine amidase
VLRHSDGPVGGTAGRARPMRGTTLKAISVAALALAATSAAAGSAAAAMPHVPDPVEFERLAPPATGATAHASRVGAIVRTGRHFNLVGLRWRGDGASGLSMRVRTHRGWGPWTTVPVSPDHAPDIGALEQGFRDRFSDPVWAGDANAVQYALRTRGRVRALRLHFIDTKGTATAAGRRRHAAASAVRPVIPAPGAPALFTRAEWGGDKCPPRAVPQYGQVTLAFVHHTVSANDYSAADSAALVRGICLYHRNSNGWNDIGYNLLVDKYGQIFEGRAGGVDAAVVGAQAQGYNAQSTGIANLGNFSTTGQTQAGLDALARLLGWKLAIHGVPPTGKVEVISTGGSLNRYPAGAAVSLDRISGHRDGDATSCPGDGLYAQLPRLRQMVVPGPVLATTAVTLRTPSLRITYGSKAHVGAILTGPGGAPLGGWPVDAQLLGRFGAWKTLTTLSSDTTGAISTHIRLAYNHALRIRFKGAAGLLPAQSKPLIVGVRPRVTASLESSSPGVIARGGRVVVNARVRPAKRAALLLVKRVGKAGAKRLVARRPVRVRSGKARATFAFRRSGAYSLSVAVLPDLKNLGARSSLIAVTVR